jgi:hypothetical protein
VDAERTSTDLDPEQRSHDWRVVLGHLQLACAIYPLLLAASCLDLALAAHARLGRWPIPSWDDPKSLDIDLRYWRTGVLLVLWPSALLATLALLPWCPGERAPARWQRLLLATCCWAAGYALLSSSTGQWFGDWFMD